ncbi:tape measure protein, partial [Methylomonas sp. SURF-1]
MSDMELKLKITADGKVAVASVNQVDQSVVDLGKDAQKAGADMASGMNTANRSAQELSRGMASVKSQAAELGSVARAQIANMAGGILSVGVAATLARDILNTNRSMEMLRAQLTSLTGSAQAGAAQFKLIQDFATRTPFEINGLTNAFITLQNMGLNPSREVMQALTDQASKLGGSQETLQAIVLQLGQAYSKGKLQQEDMVILAERGIPIYKLAGEALNKTGAEIMEMSEKGEMGRDAIDAIIKKMGELASGSNATAMETLSGKISNLSDAWHQFEDTLLQDKSEGLIKSIVSGWTETLNLFTRELSSQVDDQIATIEQRLKFRNFGFLGKFAYSVAGATPFSNTYREDIALLDMLKKQKVAEDDLANAQRQRAASQSAIAQTQQWLDEIEGVDKANAKAEAKKRHAAAEHAAQQAINKAKQEALRIEERYQELRDLSRTTDQVFIDTVAEYTKAFNSRNISLEQYINLLAKADDARDKSLQKANPTVQAVPHFYEGGMSQANYSAADKAINAELDSAAKAAEDYDRWLAKIDQRLSKMGDISGAVFDSQLGGISAVAGAFEDLQEKMAGYAQTLVEIQDESRKFSKDQTGNAKILADLKKREDQVNQDMLGSQLEGVRRLTGATANMFAEGTKGRQAMHAVEMALSAVEMAQKLGMLSVDGAAATLNQGKGDPYTAFARMAAMAALVASIISSVKGIGGSSTVRVDGAATSQAPTSGTVLGDPSAKSESINNTYQLLQDIHAKEYRELRGINTGVAALKTGINDTVTKLFQAGGLKTPYVAGLGSSLPFNMSA